MTANEKPTRRSPTKKPKAEETIAQAALRVALANYEVGKSETGVLFARRKRGHVIRALEGRAFKSELADLLEQEDGKLLNDTSFTQARSVLEARARKCEPTRVWVRCGRFTDSRGRLCIAVDMGDHEEHVVVVRPGKWTVTKKAPEGMLFGRSPLTGAFPEPERGGDITLMKKLINMSDEDFDLVVAMVVSYFNPTVSHLAMYIKGEPGTAKSSVHRFISSLIDPSPVPMRRMPKSEDDLVVAASQSYAFGYENVSQISKQFSDALCSIITGVGTAKRALYTNADVAAIATGKRILFLNGVEIQGMGDDLVDRLVVITLKRIDTRGRELEEFIDSEFERLWPQLFGAILDVLAGTLRMIANGDQHLEERPRMADAAEWLNAVDAERGTDALDTYLRSMETVAMESVGDDPVVVALRKWLESPQLGGEWSGSTARLLDNLSAYKPEDRHLADQWPRSSKGLGKRLAMHAPTLRKAGWEVEREVLRSGAKWTICLPDEDGGDDA